MNSQLFTPAAHIISATLYISISALVFVFDLDVVCHFIFTLFSGLYPYMYDALER